MEVPDGNQKGHSYIAPFSDNGGMADIVYPAQVHNHDDTVPHGTVQQKIPINMVISKESVSGYCYNCNDYRTTEIGKRVGSRLCCCFCILTVTCPLLSFVPFFVGSCYDTAHKCPECKKMMARNNLS